MILRRLSFLVIFFLGIQANPLLSQQSCIDLGVGIGVSNDEIALIDFFKNGGKWEIQGSNGHPWYKVYNLDTFKVVNGAYYNWDVDWSGKINNDAWGDGWADCFISYWDMMVDQGKIRTDGYPKGFPQTVYKYKPKSIDANQGLDMAKPVTITDFSRRIYFPKGLQENGWVLRWKGKGRIRFEGIEVNSANVPYELQWDSWTPDGSYAGRNYFFNSTNGGRVVCKHYWMIHGWVLNIIESDPTDPIRDIEFLYPGQEANYDAGQRFTPLFLERMRQFKCLRYMGYLSSNGIESRRTMASTHPYHDTYMIDWLRWNERTPENYYQINNGNGGNYEYIIDLANQTATDPWVNIPYCAGEAYADSLVRLFMEKLNPDRTLYLEVGNEMWNYAQGFDGFFWQAAKRVTEYPGLGDVEARGAHLNRIFKQVTETAGARNLPRIRRVVGGFPRYYDVNNRTVQMINPSYWDALATTWYFGLTQDNTSSNACRDPQSGTNWRTVLYNWFLAHPNDQTGFNQTYRNCLLNEFRCSGGYRNNVDVLLSNYYNKKLVCYEGGNHTFYGCTNNANVPQTELPGGEDRIWANALYPNYITNNAFVNAVCVADESAEIGQVFSEVIDSMQSAGITLANHLNFSGGSSCYGVWDLIQSRDVEAPLATLLARYNKFKVFSDRIQNNNCTQVKITLSPDTVGPGLSIKMDGINDYIEGQTAYIPDESANYTLEAWVKPYILDREQVALSFTSNSSNDNYNIIKIRDDKKVVWEIGNNGAFSAKLIGPEVEINKWYHIAVSKNVNRYTFYVNGIKVADNNFTLPVYARNRFTIGAFYKGSTAQNFFDGEIDEVKLWNTARTVDDIREYMCKKVPATYAQFSQLKSYYRFDYPDYTGSTLFDFVGRTATGRLHNITITERSRYAVSGAPIGDYSKYIYASAWSGVSLSLTHPQGDRVAVYNLVNGNPAGVQVYMIDGRSHYNDVPEYYTDISDKRVAGVFVANGDNTNYDVSYIYQGNPDVNNGGGENNLRLLRRDDFSIEQWLHAGARIDMVANSLTVPCKEKYRGEYNIAHRPSIDQVRPGSGQALFDNQTPTGNVMGKVQYLNMDDFTVTFWAKGWGEVFNFTSKLQDNACRFTITDRGNGNIGCGLRYGVYWTYDMSFGPNGYTGKSAEWHHYAVTKSGTKMRIYVDGMESSSADVTSMFHIQELYLFNAPAWQKGNFTGGVANLTLDELSVWNVPLDQSTIRDWMCKKITQAHPNECKNLVLYFNFDENQGNVLEDKRGPSDIVLTTDASGFQWVSSGAAIGDVSVADFASPENVTLAHPDGDFLEANQTAGSSYGVNLYRINNMPPDPATVSGTAIHSLDSSRYWGIYVSKPYGITPTYSIIDHYELNSQVKLSTEAELRLLSRTDNATTPWSPNISATPNTTLHTLTLTSQPRGEYVLGGTTATTFNAYLPPVSPVFLPETKTRNRDTICGNSTRLLYKLQPDPYAASYVWTLPPELDGFSTSDSIVINSSYTGTATALFIISVRSVNEYGQSAETTYAIRVYPRPTLADAGPDQIVLPPLTGANMSGNTPSASEIATWVLTGGLGTIVDLHNPTTTVNNLGTGNNYFTWNIDNGLCPVETDTTRILLAPSPQNIVLRNGDPLPLVVCQGEVITVRVIPPEDIVPDSYLWTLPSGFTLVSQNGNEETIIASSGMGGPISVAAVYSGKASLPYTSRSINISALPNKPVLVDKPSTLCLNVTDTASVQYTSTTDSLVWTLPTGIYPTVFPKSFSENIAIKAIQVVSGYIKVQSYNSGCTSLSAVDSFLVNVRSAPLKPELYLGTDGGTADADCANQNLLLWVNNPDNAITYEWKWATDVDFVEYFNDNHSGALFKVKNGNANVYARSVLGTGECSASEWFEFYSWPQAQGPALVTGVAITNPTGQAPLGLQVGQTYTFQVTGTAEHYYWNIPTGFELVADNDMSDAVNKIRVTSATAGALEVYPITLRGCAGTPFQLNIGVTGALLPPTYVSGLTEVCQGANLHIFVSAISGATQYIWTLPNNSSFTTAIPELNVPVANYMKGIMTVVARNAGTQSQPLEIPITINATFLNKPVFIDENNKPVEELEICSGDYNRPIYIANNLASSYVWDIHGSAIQFEPRNQPGHDGDANYELINRTSPVDTMMPVSWVDWRCRRDGSDGGYIRVTAVNGCGGLNATDSIHYYWAQPLDLFVPEFTIAPERVCVGSKVSFEIKPIPGATQYIWSLPNGLVASDAITITPAITADVVYGTGGVVKVFATSNVCGGTKSYENSSVPISISGSPVDFHFIDQPIAACPGTSLKYSVNDIGAGTYTWTLPGGLRTTQVDDKDATGITINGSWSVNSRTNMVNGQYHATSNDNTAKKITYRPSLPYAGRYKVSLSYFTNWDTRADVPVTVNSATGAAIQYVNMTVTPGDGIWQELGEFDFNAGTTGSVVIGAQASGGSLTIADAVKFEILGITGDTTITVPAQQGESGAVCVSATIPQCSSPYTICTDPINLAGTLTTPVLTQQENAVCTGLTYIFRASDIGADTYTWHLPVGMSIAGATGILAGLGREVNVRMDSNTGALVKIGVHGVINACSVKSDTVYTNNILFNGTGCKLANPVFIAQPVGLCIGSNATYIATIVQYAESYEWTLPTGLRQTGTLATGIITTTVPTITVESNGFATGALGRISVRALSSTIANSDLVNTTSTVTVSSAPSFTPVAYNSSSCSLPNGRIELSGLTANTTYAISYNNGATLIGPASMASNASGVIQVLNLAAGNYSNISVDMSGCASVNSSTLSVNSPVPAQITGVTFTNPLSCGSTGAINIALSGATAGNTYYIDFDNNGIFNDTGIVASNALLLTGIQGGALITRLVITESATGCQSNSPITGAITDPSPVTISTITLINPAMCGDSATMKIALTGATNGDNYAIDFTNDGTADSFRPVINDTITVYKIPISTVVRNLLITNASTGCRASKSQTGTFSAPTPAIINSLRLINPLGCKGQGSIKIALSGATQGSTYSIDYNSDGAFDNSGTVNHDTITLPYVSVGTSVTKLRIRNAQTGCESSINSPGSISRPVSASITNALFISPIRCGGAGSLKIVLSGALSGSNYTIDYNNDGSIDNGGSVVRDTITLSGLPVNTAVNNLSVTSTATGCPSFSNIVGKISDPTPFTISSIQYINPNRCGETGSVQISLTGANSREFFNIDYNNNGTFDDTCTSNSGILFRNGLAVGQTITGLTLLSSLSNCQVTSNLVGVIQAPAVPAVSLAAINALCANSPKLALAGGLPAGGIYSIDGKAATVIDPQNIGVGNHALIYTVKAANNCSNSDTVNFLINTVPLVYISGEQALCPGSLEIPYNTEYDSQNIYTWSISGGRYTNGANAANIKVNWDVVTSGTIKLLSINTSSSCKDSSSIPVNFLDVTSPAITSCASEFKAIVVKDDAGKFYIVKSQDTTYIPKALDVCSKDNLRYTFAINNGVENNVTQFVGYRLNASAPATIHWKVYDQAGNSNDQCITNVNFEFDEKVPSAFSPNNDNVNDTWDVDFLLDYPDCTVKVYNRWGMLVFESDQGYKTKWNGTCKGVILPVDSYYYVISLGKGNRVLKGYVTIVY